MAQARPPRRAHSRFLSQAATEFGDRKPLCAASRSALEPWYRTRSKMASCAVRTPPRRRPLRWLEELVTASQPRGCSLSAAFVGDHRSAAAAVCQGRFRTAQRAALAVVAAACHPAGQRQRGGLCPRTLRRRFSRSSAERPRHRCRCASRRACRHVVVAGGGRHRTRHVYPARNSRFAHQLLQKAR